jgi:DNA repair protein RadC
VALIHNSPRGDDRSLGSAGRSVFTEEQTNAWRTEKELKEWPEDEQPRERLMKYGAGTLSDAREAWRQGHR